MDRVLVPLLFGFLPFTRWKKGGFPDAGSGFEENPAGEDPPGPSIPG
jgi:hypothetical protein